MSAPIHRGWYNANETRAYPLDEQATQLGDSGARLPTNILADVNLSVPGDLSTRIFVSGVTCTAGLVTATFTAETLSGPVPVAAVTVVRPVQIYRNYAVTSLYPGVSGWVVFGHGIDEHTGLAVRCSTAAQGLLASRAARTYTGLPVTSIGINGTGLTVQGLVTLDVSGDLVIENSQRTIDGVCKDVILIRLDTSINLDLPGEYAGPCGRRPEAGTCFDTPIRSINGVIPACDGEITVDFKYPLYVTAAQCNDALPTAGLDGVLSLDLPFGLHDVCPTPRDIGGSDACEEQAEPLILGAEVGPGVTLLEEDSLSSSASSEDGCPPLPDPFCDNFTDPLTIMCYWRAFAGSWSMVDGESESSSSSLSLGAAGKLEGSPGAVADFIGSVVEGSSTFNKVVRMCAEMPDYADAGDRGVRPSNMLIIFGYRDEDSFWFAGFDLSGELSDTYGTGLIIGRYSGGLAFPEVHLGLPVPIELGVKHQITLEVTQAGSNVTIRLSDAMDPLWTVQAETTTDYIYNGQVGLGAYGGSINVFGFGIGACDLEC